MSKHTFQLIFSDIDGTLLNSQHQVTANTKTKIQATVNSGIPFILVSARPPKAIESIKKQLEIHAPIISYGGGLILSDEGETLKSYGLSLETGQFLYQHIQDHFPHLSTSIFAGQDWFAKDGNEPWIKQESEITEIKPMAGDINILTATKSEIHKILCMGPAAKIHQAFLQLSVDFPDLNVYKSKDTYLEIMDKKSSKAQAIKALCQHYNVLPENTIAFGDNYNDVDMICFAGLGIAMANAPDDIKQQADYVTKDNDHEGVCHALKKFLS